MEQILTVAASGQVRVERIVSPPGYAGPPDEWFDQAWPEWVAVLAGSACLLFEAAGREQRLAAGDHLLIPARCRHRVAWTDPDEPTIWLAVHLPPT